MSNHVLYLVDKEFNTLKQKRISKELYEIIRDNMKINLVTKDVRTGEIALRTTRDKFYDNVSVFLREYNLDAQKSLESYAKNCLKVFVEDKSGEYNTTEAEKKAYLQVIDDIEERADQYNYITE